MLRRILFVSFLAACAGSAPDSGAGSGSGSGTGSGGGDGTGSGGGSGGGGGGTSTGATQFLDQMGHKICDEAFMCKSSFPTDFGGTFDEVFGTTATQCYTDSLASFDPMKVEQQITAGTIKFNAADAATCLAGLTFPATCADFWQNGPTMPAACDTALVGTIADGQACVVDLECSNVQSYCDPTSKKCTVDTTGARTAPRYDQPIGPAVLN